MRSSEPGNDDGGESSGLPVDTIPELAILVCSWPRPVRHLGGSFDNPRQPQSPS